MAYHSRYNDVGERYKQCCGCPIIPLAPQGAAAQADNSDAVGEQSLDPVDEALELFRPNSLFKTFDVRGPGDKLLVYLIFFINSCLRRLADRKPPPAREEARGLLVGLAHDRFPLPGQAGFPLGGLMAPPGSREEEEALRSYLRQCREETGRRLLDRLYGSGASAAAAGPPNKHWLAFAHRRFMDRAP